MNKYVPYTETLEFAAEYLANILAESRKKGYQEPIGGIVPFDFFILETIKTYPGMIQVELANKIAIQSSYISKILTKLENLGYIKREQSVRGTRQVVYKLYVTESGNDLYKKVQKMIKIKINEQLSDEEFCEYRELAKKVLEVAEKIKKRFNVKF